MATARTTSKSASAAAPTAISEWKKSELPLELPSGKFMECRKASFRVFLAAGIIPNELMQVVQKALSKGVEPDMSEFSKDLDKINEMGVMVDRVVVYSSVSPKVHPAPELKENPETGETEEDRRDDLLYVDEVDDEDKMFIYQWVTGGTRDLAKFRAEFAESVASVQPSKALES